MRCTTPSRSVAEFVALAKKARPGFSYGSNGNGTAQHLIGTQFENLTGLDLTHVPCKGSGPLTTDLLGGQIPMSFDTVTPVLAHIRSGKLRALAEIGAEPVGSTPEQMAAQIRAETDRFAGLVKAAKVTIERGSGAGVSPPRRVHIGGPQSPASSTLHSA